MTNQEYLASVVNELMVDEEWQFPKEFRAFLQMDLEWTLLIL